MLMCTNICFHMSIMTYPQSNIHAQRNTHKHMHTSNSQTVNCSCTCLEEGTHVQKHTHLLSIKKREAFVSVISVTNTVIVLIVILFSLSLR